MAMELTFLGTGAAYPSPVRGASSVVLRYEGKYWMFDCGEGTQVQLMRSNVRIGKISKIFITHLHGDHIFGLPGLICSISLGLSTFQDKPLEIYGPKGLRKFLRVAFQLSRAQLNFNYVVHELNPISCQLSAEYQVLHDECDDQLHLNELLGSTVIYDNNSESWHVYKDEQLTVEAGILSHRVPCFGYSIEEKSSVGKLDSKKLLTLGIPPGKLYSKIKAGESIESPNGEIIHPEDVMGPSQQGRKVVIMGDTCNSSKMTKLCNNVTVLVHEATLSNDMAASAIEKGHSTPEMAATFAHSVNASRLVLTHFSQRYKTSHDAENSIAVLKEQAENALQSDSNVKVIIAEDLMLIGIRKEDLTC